jgi:hypothetical protein
VILVTDEYVSNKHIFSLYHKYKVGVNDL